MIQDIHQCWSMPTNVRWRIFFRPAVDLAALFLLAIPVPLQAQSNGCGVFCLPKFSQIANSRSFLETSTTESTPGGEAGRISTVPDESLPASTHSSTAELAFGLGASS